MDRGKVLTNYAIAVVRAWDEEGWKGPRVLEFTVEEIADLLSSYPFGWNQLDIQKPIRLFGCEVRIVKEAK